MPGEWYRAADVTTPSGPPVFDGITDSHCPLKIVRSRRQAGADQIELIWREAPDPGTVCVLVASRLVRDLQMVQAVFWMPLAVIAVRAGQEMGLPDVRARVAVAPKHRGERRHVPRNGHPVAHDAEGRRVVAAQEADATGHTNGALHERMVEVDAFTRQPIHHGRAYLRVAVGPQRVPALLVPVQQEDIGSSHRPQPTGARLGLRRGKPAGGRVCAGTARSSPEPSVAVWSQSRLYCLHRWRPESGQDRDR